MRIILQRVSKASVTVENEIVGEIKSGLLVLVGFSKTDTADSFKPVIEKLLTMRIFSNDKGKFDYSVTDIKGEILLVPQFTLFADVSRGRRPEFFTALEPSLAKKLFQEFFELFKKTTELKVASGIFGADMKVELLNDGPVTISFDSSDII